MQGEPIAPFVFCLFLYLFVCWCVGVYMQTSTSLFGKRVVSHVAEAYTTNNIRPPEMLKRATHPHHTEGLISAEQSPKNETKGACRKKKNTYAVVETLFRITLYSVTHLSIYRRLYLPHIEIIHLTYLCGVRNRCTTVVSTALA